MAQNGRDKSEKKCVPIMNNGEVGRYDQLVNGVKAGVHFPQVAVMFDELPTGSIIKA